jgi:integrase
MRIGEVIHLKNQDVDIENGVIKAINGKNGVSRYIPVTDSLLVIIKSYVLKQKNRSPGTSFFVSPYTSGKYSYSAMKYMFQKICTAANIKTENGKLPNLHSIRHTFCTRSLEQMLNNGIRVKRLTN